MKGSSQTTPYKNPRNSRFKAEPPWAAIPIPTVPSGKPPPLLSQQFWFSPGAQYNLETVGPYARLHLTVHRASKLFLGFCPSWCLIPSLKKTRQQHWQPTALLLRLAQDICGTSDPYVEVYVNDVKQVRLWFRGVSQVIWWVLAFQSGCQYSARIMGKSKFTTTLESACWVW